MDKSGLSAMGRRTEAPPVSWLMQLALERPQIISLAAGFIDHETLPAREIRAILQEILCERETAQAALQYGTTAGDPGLRRLTAERLARLDQTACARAGVPPPDPTLYEAERVLIANGSQQMLYLVTECLCDPGDIVLVEDPTYFVFLGIGQSHGLCYRGVRMAENGLELKHLEEVLASLGRAGALPRVKFLYSVSYYQNPTGITAQFAKKAQALELLRSYERRAEHPIYLVEDAAYRELRFGGGDTPSALAAPGARDRVAYLGSYSKPFATGARVGFGLLPNSMLTVMARLKGNHDFGTASLLQHLLARALASGRYDHHLKTLERRYARKARIMTDDMPILFPANVQWQKPGGGIYVWARLPAGFNTGFHSEIFQTALARDVLYVPGELCYADDPTREKPAHEMRLSFGSASEADLRTGIARLGAVLQRLVKA